MKFRPIQSFTRKRLSDVVSDQIKQLISDGALSTWQPTAQIIGRANWFTGTIPQ